MKKRHGFAALLACGTFRITTVFTGRRLDAPEFRGRVMRLFLSDSTPSVLDSYVQRQGKCEKMSKSRGNCVTVDMVVYGVAEIDAGYEFRDTDNRVIHDWKRFNIWRDKSCGGDFFTGAAFGQIPVFL